MTNTYVVAGAATLEHAIGSTDRGDEEVMHALVTAGALVALADGRLDDVERDELVGFVDRRGFVPAFSSDRIAKAFDDRVQLLEDRYNPNVIIQTLRPLAGRSLASIVSEESFALGRSNQATSDCRRTPDVCPASR